LIAKIEVYKIDGVLTDLESIKNYLKKGYAVLALKDIETIMTKLQNWRNKT